MDILNFIVQSNATKDDNVLFDLLKEFVLPLGFDKLIFCLMTDHPSINEPAMHGKISGYGEDWMKFYMASGYDTIDPIRKECAMQPQRIFTWEGISKIRPFNKNERLVMNQAEDAGLKNGIAVSIKNPHNEIAALGYASSRGGIDLEPTLLCQLKLISIQFYDMYLLLKSNQTAELHQQRIKLTNREKEVLQWAAVGKSNLDIATILSVTEKTIEYFFKQCFIKLEADNRTSAITKASRLSLIKLDSDFLPFSIKREKGLIY